MFDETSSSIVSLGFGIPDALDALKVIRLGDRSNKLLFSLAELWGFVVFSVVFFWSMGNGSVIIRNWLLRVLLK
jgi:hypothetical protein